MGGACAELIQCRRTHSYAKSNALHIFVDLFDRRMLCLPSCDGQMADGADGINH